MKGVYHLGRVRMRVVRVSKARALVPLQAAGKALPPDVVELQREVLRLASGGARETRYAMLASALLLLLAPLPTDIAEQVCTQLYLVQQHPDSNPAHWVVSVVLQHQGSTSVSGHVFSRANASNQQRGSEA